jgi:molybdopterin molybdotransferase
MASVDEHAAHVAALIAPALDRTSESVWLADALDRVTAHDVLSPVDLPLFRNSQMDGYAVHAADLTRVPVTLPLAGEVSARPSTPPVLARGTAVRIMTGAVIPDGADAVVPVEDTQPAGQAVTITRTRAPGEYVRDRGSDVTAGDRLLSASQRLAPRHLAVLAAAGLTAVDVRQRIRIAVITTGSELIEPGDDPTLGQVFDSNGTALDAAIRMVGAVVSYRAHVSDDAELFLAAITHAAQVSDLIVTSGGISMGEYEVVREVLSPLGASVGTVAMQPGGPQATAVFDGVPVLCFPGNPVSTQLSFEIFLAPHLREVAGLPARVRRMRTLDVAVRSTPNKRQFLRARTTGLDTVTLVAGPSSHLVAGLAASDSLVIVPEHVTELAAGELVETWAL